MFYHKGLFFLSVRDSKTEGVATKLLYRATLIENILPVFEIAGSCFD